MQDQPDSFTVRFDVVPGCTCQAHGLLVRHAPNCKAFIPGSALTREQVHELAEAFVALYDDRVEQGKRRRMLTRDGRALARQAIRHADALLGTEHRYTRP